MVQYLIGNDNNYIEMAKTVQAINEQYCKLYDYDYEFDYLTKDQIKKIYGECGFHQMIRYKLQFIKEKLEKNDCDYLVFVDADAAVSKPTLKITDLIDDKHELFLSRGNDKWDQIRTITTVQHQLTQLLLNPTILLQNYYDNTLMKELGLYRFGTLLSVYGHVKFNQGFIIVKNTKRMKEFFTDATNLSQYLKDIVYECNTTIDGKAICLMLLQKKYNDSYIHMYEQAQGGFANSYNMRYDQENTFLMHNYGQAMTFNQKLIALKRLKNNKWWSLFH